VKKISNDKQGGLLTFGMLLTLWSSSGAMTAIIDTLNGAYDIKEGRPWWKVRLTAIGLTVGVSIFILASFALVIVGPTFATRLADMMGLGAAFEWTWKILQWPVIFALVSAAIAGIYYWGPDAEQDWVWLTPGAIFATTLWLLASLGFKYYVASMGNYTETYGAIGAFMVLMLWFYISGLVILIGAEMPRRTGRTRARRCPVKNGRSALLACGRGSSAVCGVVTRHPRPQRSRRCCAARRPCRWRIRSRSPRWPWLLPRRARTCRRPAGSLIG
jgi:YihY family inner membrane protein